MTTEGAYDFFDRVRFRGQPRANPDNLVQNGQVRFTILTPRLARLEWSETGQFEDRGTYAFPTRFAPAPAFAARREEGWLVIDTGALTLRYQEGSGRFTAGNLTITFQHQGKGQTWVPGMSNPANLFGTRRTLDRCEGDASLEKGLLSRAGWALFDDSRSVLFDPGDGWVRPRREQEVQDWYFFAYGHDYKGALADYARFGGQIPLIPRYMLGAWWSRYWAYSDQDLKQLVVDFESHGLPLDVLVVDMDWHTPQSWTGYTWNRELFPDPPTFLNWVHDKGLRVTLNLHPAEGVQSFEEIYPRFAEAMGIDPTSGQTIPFRIADRRFVRNYFELLHHPREEEGVDFWWVDWQQGEGSEVEGLDPLPWLNHLHFQDSARRGRRPILFSRWGGLGNHRYPIGFSGDTFVTWRALQFQPFFTATASNVLFGWWSHDIGGHMGGPTEPELYARWVQVGALSPCLRLHATKDRRAERRPWKYPPEVYQAAKAAFDLRYQLVPYLYTMARVAHDTGLSLCRPTYYEYPQEDAAYAARTQYFLGDQILAAPIVHPADPATGLAAADVWIPPGTWIDDATKETFAGPRWVRLLGGLDRVPMLVKAGTILPRAAPVEPPTTTHLASGTTDALPRDRLILSVFPGEEGHFRLYEDDGLTNAYQAGQFEWTEITTTMEAPDVWQVHIAAVEGRCDTLPDRRGYEIRLEGSRRPEKILIADQQSLDWTYEPAELRTSIHLPAYDKRQPITVTALAPGGMSALGEAHNGQLIRADIMRLLDLEHLAGEEEDALLDTVLRTYAPGRADAVARLGGPFVRFVEFTALAEAAQQLGRLIVVPPARPRPSCDVEITFTFEQGVTSQQHTVKLANLTEPRIVDTPFAFDGQVQSGRWSAQARITWQGEMLTYQHESKVLFPTIYAWRAVVYNQEEAPLALQQVVDECGTPNEGLGWKVYDQTPEQVIDVNQPHSVVFAAEHWQALEAGVPLVAYLATTIVSPDEREVVLQFQTGGPVALWLNGEEVDEIPAEAEEGIHPLFRKAKTTAVTHLRAGDNHLLVQSRRPLRRALHEGGRYWFFGAALTTPAGELMTDLIYRSAAGPTEDGKRESHR